MTPTVLAFLLPALGYAVRHFDVVSKVFARVGLRNPIHAPDQPPPAPAPVEDSPAVTTDFLHQLIRDAVSAAVKGVVADVQKQAAAGTMPTSLGVAFKAELHAAVQAAVAAALADVKK